VNPDERITDDLILRTAFVQLRLVLAKSAKSLGERCPFGTPSSNFGYIITKVRAWL